MYRTSNNDLFMTFQLGEKVHNVSPPSYSLQPHNTNKQWYFLAVFFRVWAWWPLNILRDCNYFVWRPEIDGHTARF